MMTPHRIATQTRRIALTLDGVADYGVCGTLDVAGWSAITLAGWVWSDTGNTGDRFIAGIGSIIYGLWWSSGQPALVVSTTGGVLQAIRSVSPATKYDNMWVYVVGTWASGGAGDLWIWTAEYGWEKNDSDTGAKTGTISDTTTMTVGRTAAGSSAFWKGEISEVQVWDVKRTEAQAKGNRHRAHPPHPNLKGLWQAQILSDLSDSNAKTPAHGDEDLSGTPSASWKLFDLSGNGEHVALHSLPTSGVLPFKRAA